MNNGDLEEGRLKSVNPVVQGDEVAQASGANGLLILGNGADFGNDGWVRINGVLYEYVSVKPTVVSGFDEPVELTLTPPWPAADVPVETRVDLWDADSGQPAVEYVADVILHGQSVGDSMPAAIDHALVPLLRQGIRTEGGEAVTLRWEDDDLNVIAVDGKVPSLNGDYFDPHTIPDPVPVDPPTASPTLTAYGMTDGVMLRADPAMVATGTSIEYHISTVDGFTATPGDPTTLLPDTPAKNNLYFAKTLPDGTPLDPDTTYFFASYAVNAAGYAPAPSVQVTGKVDPNAVIEVVTNLLVAAQIIAKAIEAGRVNVGTGYWSADEGFVLPQPDGTVTRLTVDGVTPSTLAGFAILLGATIKNNVNLYGLAQEFGTFRLTNGITDPAVKAGMSRTWTNLPLTDLTSKGASLLHGLTENADGTTWQSAYTFGGLFILAASKTTGAWLANAVTGTNVSLFAPTGGITRLGTDLYVLGQDLNRGGAWYVYKINSSFAKVGEFLFGNPQNLPALGNDGTNLVIGWCTAAADINVRTYTTAGVNLSTYILSNPVGGQFDTGGIYVGSADFGADRILIAPAGGSDLLAFASTGVRAATHDFTRAGGTGVRGLFWDGTRFRHLDAAGRIWGYATGHPSTSTIWGGYTWYDADTSSGSTVHETKVSPAVSFSWPARSRLVITAQPAPDADDTDPTRLDKANLVRFWAGGSSTTMRLQASPAVGVSSASLESLDTGSAIAPTSSSFTGAAVSPGVFESAAAGAGGQPHTQVKGDGSVLLQKFQQAGTQATGTFGGAGSANAVAVAVTFTEPFLATPNVILQASSDPTNNIYWASNITTTGFTLNAYRVTGTAAFTVQWTASRRTQ